MHLINNDDIPLEISVQDDSKAIQAAGWDLTVTPSQATLQPNEKLPLDISVEAMRPGQLSRPIKIKCKHKSEPLLLYVKALAHAMVVEVILEDQLGKTQSLYSDQINHIKFDTVELHENAIRTIHIVNLSEHFVEYAWEKRSSDSRSKVPITIDPMTAIIPANERFSTVMCFNPQKLGELPQTSYALKISHGETYNIELSGQAVNPGVHFSFMKKNFGPTFIHR